MTRYSSVMKMNHIVICKHTLENFRYYTMINIVYKLPHKISIYHAYIQYTILFIESFNVGFGDPVMIRTALFGNICSFGKVFFIGITPDMITLQQMRYG